MRRNDQGGHRRNRSEILFRLDLDLVEDFLVKSDDDALFGGAVGDA